MNIRENTMAILHYRDYDYMPVVHFGYWSELLDKWKAEGRFKDGDNVSRMLGFDYEWGASFGCNDFLMPGFEWKKIKDNPDGSYIQQNGNGLIELVKPGVESIPATIDTLLKDDEAWETLYRHRLQPSPDRIDLKRAQDLALRQDSITNHPFGIQLGSLYGHARDICGVEGISYLAADYEDTYIALLDALADIVYDNAKRMLGAGLRPDFGHFWEDICFKNGPLVNPKVFREAVGPHYKRISELLLEYGCDIISLDCDGCIDKLVPIWLENGVNTMFPIEVGTWGASIAPWREKYGRSLRGVGGMDKRVFAYDYAAVDAEIERLKPLVALGGYIPCPDHRLPPDAKWENVQYYTERFRKEFAVR